MPSNKDRRKFLSLRPRIFPCQGDGVDVAVDASAEVSTELAVDTVDDVTVVEYCCPAVVVSLGQITSEPYPAS